MSDKKIKITGDEMIDAKLMENSKKLNISVDELIVRYIKRGLFFDDYNELPKPTKEEQMEINRLELERERKMGLKPPEKNRFDVFINRWSKTED